MNIKKHKNKKKSRQILLYTFLHIQENYYHTSVFPSSRRKSKKLFDLVLPPLSLPDITDNHLPDEIVNTQTACGAHFWRPNVEIAISYCSPIWRGKLESPWK